MLPQKIMKIRYSRLAKNAFVIQHLLHYSIVYTFTHYRTIMMDGCHTHNTGNILSISKNFYLLNFYNYLFFLSFFLGEIFSGNSKKFSGNSKKFSGTSGSLVRYFFQPCLGILHRTFTKPHPTRQKL